MAAFQREFVKVGQMATKVVSLGGGVSAKPKRLILILPGNPGVASFYEAFMSSLHTRLGGHTPVWTVGHGGHDIAGQAHAIPSRLANRSLFTLEGQIRHKIDFISTHVPEDCELVLLGHSIGCKIIMEILKHFESDEIRQNSIRAGYLLFPTIERMYESPAGFIAWIQTAYLAPILIGLAWILHNILPQSILSWLVQYWMSGRSKPLDDCVIKSVVDLVHPTSVGNSLFMAYIELQEVCELDKDSVVRFSDKIRFYFGADDHWCPVKYYEDLKVAVPQVRAQVCTRDIIHAFVLGYADETAIEVADWFKLDNLFVNN